MEIWSIVIKYSSHFEQIFMVSYIEEGQIKCGSLSRNECGYPQEWVKYPDCESSQNAYLQTVKRVMLEQNLL